MKLRFILCAISLLQISLAAAQTTKPEAATAVPDAEIRKTTETLTEKYRLDADQAKQMYHIQVRKQRNLAEIADLQQSNPVVYRQKLRNVQDGTISSIRRILQNKEQVETFRKTQSELRSQQGAKRKELLSQKASKETIEKEMLLIYAE